MAKLKNKIMRFPASDSPDVIGYKLYVEESPNEVTYDSESVDLGNVTEVDLSTISVITTKDGVFNLGVTAVDDAGNESSMSIASNVSLDFNAPNPVGIITISDS